MLNSFWFWWTVYISVILILYIIELCFEINNEIKPMKKYYNIKVTKAKFVNEVLKWYMKNMNYPNDHKYYPQLKISCYKTKRN